MNFKEFENIIKEAIIENNFDRVSEAVSFISESILQDIDVADSIYGNKVLDLEQVEEKIHYFFAMTSMFPIKSVKINIKDEGFELCAMNNSNTFYFIANKDSLKYGSLMPLSSDGSYVREHIYLSDIGWVCKNKDKGLSK